MVHISGSHLYQLAWSPNPNVLPVPTTLQIQTILRSRVLRMAIMSIEQILE